MGVCISSRCSVMIIYIDSHNISDFFVETKF